MIMISRLEFDLCWPLAVIDTQAGGGVICILYNALGILYNAKVQIANNCTLITNEHAVRANTMFYNKAKSQPTNHVL